MADKKQETTLTESMTDIFDSNDIEFATIDGFAPGKTLRIVSLTAGDIIEWAEAGENKEAKRTAALRLICKSLVDASGKHYALDEKNIEVFRSKAHKTTERIVREILKLNGMVSKSVKDLEKELKDAQDAEKKETKAKND